MIQYRTPDVLISTSFSILIGVFLAFLFLEHHQFFDNYKLDLLSSTLSSFKSINKN